jgi:hypothetical protein
VKLAQVVTLDAIEVRWRTCHCRGRVQPRARGPGTSTARVPDRGAASSGRQPVPELLGHRKVTEESFVIRPGECVPQPRCLSGVTVKG